ncbi:MAG TPA: hypothetical protein VK772_07815, partial [Puia sp.]|nr:hypothetical protein [Puia sp.]
MNKILSRLQGRPINFALICLLTAIICFTSCNKFDNGFRNELSPHDFSSDVIDKWMTLEIRIYRDATGIANG